MTPEKVLEIVTAYFDERGEPMPFDDASLCRLMAIGPALGRGIAELLPIDTEDRPALMCELAVVALREAFAEEEKRSVERAAAERAVRFAPDGGRA